MLLRGQQRLPVAVGLGPGICACGGEGRGRVRGGRVGLSGRGEYFGGVRGCVIARSRSVNQSVNQPTIAPGLSTCILLGELLQAALERGYGLLVALHLVGEVCVVVGGVYWGAEGVLGRGVEGSLVRRGGE